MYKTQNVMRVTVNPEITEMLRLNRIQEAARYDTELAMAVQGYLGSQKTPDLGGLYGMVLDRWALHVLNKHRVSQFSW